LGTIPQRSTKRDVAVVGAGVRRYGKRVKCEREVYLRRGWTGQGGDGWGSMEEFVAKKNCIHKKDEGGLICGSVGVGKKSTEKRYPAGGGRVLRWNMYFAGGKWEEKAGGGR